MLQNLELLSEKVGGAYNIGACWLQKNWGERLTIQQNQQFWPICKLYLTSICHNECYKPKPVTYCKKCVRPLPYFISFTICYLLWRTREQVAVQITHLGGPNSAGSFMRYNQSTAFTKVNGFNKRTTKILCAPLLPKVWKHAEACCQSHVAKSEWCIDYINSSYCGGKLRHLFPTNFPVSPEQVIFILYNVLNTCT